MPIDSESLRDGVEAMSRFVVGDALLLETLQRVSELACAAVSSADMVGITMLLEGRPSTAAFTDDAAPEITRRSTRLAAGRAWTPSGITRCSVSATWTRTFSGRRSARPPLTAE